MKQTLLLTLLFALFYFSCLAQEKTARKLFDFGVISCDEMTERVERLRSALKNEPDAKAYIIYYGGFYLSTQRKGKVKKNILIDHDARSFAWRISRQLTFYKEQEFDKTKIEIINGGYQDKVLFEVWLVPKGATAPTPNPTVNPKDQRFRKIKAVKKQIPCIM